MNVETGIRTLLLHVTNGESAGNTLRQTGIGGAVLPWQDVLHEGPVPAVSRAELRRLRAAFLASCGWGSRRTLLSSLERRDRQFVAALRDGLQVVLWFEHDLYDQLQLLDALALAHGESTSPQLIVVGAFPGKPSFAGLGELTSDELETLWPARELAAEDTLAVAQAIWEAFCAPEPSALAEWSARTLPSLPFVTPALRRLLEELPAASDGLAATERRALQAVVEGARTPQAAFLAVQHAEEAPFLGDAWFYRALVTLGRLLETHDGTPLPAAPPLTDGQVFARLPIRLTEEGERLLRGELDRVELLGVDRWLGGTHVTADNLWRWDGVAGVLIPPA